MLILDKLIKEGWWKGAGDSGVIEIPILEDDLARLKQGSKIIKQDPEGAFVLIYLPAGKSESKDIQIERLPIAAEGSGD